jgi:hypothetical protein
MMKRKRKTTLKRISRQVKGFLGLRLSLPARFLYEIPYRGFANPSLKGTTHDPFARLCGSGVDHSTFNHPRQPDS